MRQNIVDPFSPGGVQPEGTPRELRQFSAVAGAILLAVAAVHLWRGGGIPAALAWAGAGVLVAGAGFLAPDLVRPVFAALMVLTKPVGRMISLLVLAAVYFAVFTPLGILFRLAGRDSLTLRRRPPGGSFWAAVPEPGDLRRYLKQY